jgi:hypothetical protein
MTKLIDAVRKFCEEAYKSARKDFGTEQNNVSKEAMLMVIIMEMLVYDRLQMFAATKLKMIAMCKQL